LSEPFAVWLREVPDEDDPLRQGDLLLGVTFPSLKLPLPLFTVGKNDQTATPASSANLIVVSQCCDNVKGDYAAVAPVGPLGGLKEYQREALLNPEPVLDGEVLSNYNLDYFCLEHHVDCLEDPGPNRYLVVNLRRIASFYGDCTHLRSRRASRMSTAARRLLRIKLGLLWARAEDDDVAILAEQGLPPGLTPRPGP
jgi:hypothetical protein